MKIQSIGLNLFRAKNVNETQNPFATNNCSNPFAGELKTDIFQSSSVNNSQPNVFARKAAEFASVWNQGVANLKNGTKEFIAPAISFAGKIQAGYNKLNSIRMEDLFENLKKEISMIGLDKDVKKYLRMSASDLRGELAKELAA